MKILAEPYPDNSLGVRFICDKCGCVYEAGEDEMTVTMTEQSRRPTPNGGKILKTEIRAEAQCPRCKLKINNGRRVYELVIG